MVNQGDIVIDDFDPSLGSEQKGKRPGLVISNETYHKYTKKFAIVLPITSTVRMGFPLHIYLDSRTSIQGQILCEQLKTLNLSVRNLVTIEKLPDDLLLKTLSLVKLLF